MDPGAIATGPQRYVDDPATANIDEGRMYCIVGTSDDLTDETLLKSDLAFDTSSCGDLQVNPNDPTEQISYDICDAVKARAEADGADLKAMAAQAAAVKL